MNLLLNMSTNAEAGCKDGFPQDLGFFHLVTAPSPLGPFKIFTTQERECWGGFQLFKSSAWKGHTISLLISVARWLRGIAVTWTQEGEETVCRSFLSNVYCVAQHTQTSFPGSSLTLSNPGPVVKQKQKTPKSKWDPHTFWVIHYLWDKVPTL